MKKKIFLIAAIVIILITAGAIFILNSTTAIFKNPSEKLLFQSYLNSKNITDFKTSLEINTDDTNIANGKYIFNESDNNAKLEFSKRIENKAPGGVYRSLGELAAASAPDYKIISVYSDYFSNKTYIQTGTEDSWRYSQGLFKYEEDYIYKLYAELTSKKSVLAYLKNTDIASTTIGETVENRPCTKVQGTISAKAVVELLKKNEVYSDICLKLSQDKTDNISSFIENVPGMEIEIYIDDKTAYPLKISCDPSKLIQAVLQNAKIELGSNVAKPSFDECNYEITFLKLNTNEKVDVPDGI